MIGNIIRRARLSRGWSQEELGRRLGVTGVMVCKVETGAAQVPVGRVAKLAALLGLAASRISPRCPHCGRV